MIELATSPSERGTRRTRRAGRALFVGVSVVMATVTVPAGWAAAAPHSAVGRAAPAQAWGAAEEQAFVGRINGLRTSKGLAPLAVDGELTEQARLWSETMRLHGDIFHSQNLAGGISSDWQKLGENVGVGPTVDALFDAFVKSPKHYENLVDPAYRFVGIGVVWDGDKMFTAHRFMALQPARRTPTAPRVTSAPATSPPATAAPTTAAPITATPPAQPAATVPGELAATEPTTGGASAAAPSAPVAAPPSANPERVELLFRSLSGFFS